MTTLQIERSKQLEYNLAVLKRRDAEISRVLDMAGHVVLYQFNEESKAWDRRNMEGSLFVVERTSEPRHQFVVLNRLSSENLVETIDDTFQTELTEQFLLYRNLQSEILGVWFYSPPERAAIAELLDKLHAGEVPPPADDPAPAAPTASAAVPPAPPPPEAAPPPGATGQSSVANFFNMVAGAAVGGAPPPMPPSALTATEAAAPPAAPAAPPVPTTTAPPPTDSLPAPKPADLAAMKAKLATQLRSLLDDDQFLSLLATEYIRQNQRAMLQARQQAQLRAAAAAKAPE